MKKVLILAAILAAPSFAMADQPKATGLGIKTATLASDGSVEGTPPRNVGNGAVSVRPGNGKATVKKGKKHKKRKIKKAHRK